MATIIIETKSNLSETEFEGLRSTLKRTENKFNEYFICPGTNKDMNGYKVHIILRSGERVVSLG